MSRNVTRLVTVDLFGEAKLIGINFSVILNTIMNNEFKQFREISENRNGSVVAHSGMIASFK
jgi:post-segregation antitoxin (ccd killing protein)